MYFFYPITNLELWFKQYGHLLKNNDFWRTPYLILLYGKSLADWIEKRLVNEYNVCLGTIHPEHVDSSLLYWTQHLLNKNSPKKPIIVAEEKLLFLRLYQANKKLSLLPSDSPQTISYLKKLAKLFWFYQCEEYSLTTIETPPQTQLTNEETLQRLLWQELFASSSRQLLTLKEALDRLAELTFSPKDLTFSSLFYFSAYQDQAYMLRFLHILSQKGFKVHHICFNLPQLNDKLGLASIKKACCFHFEHLKNSPKTYSLALELKFQSPKSYNLLQATQCILKSKELKNYCVHEDDDSLSFVQTTNALREVEVISDKILALLQEPSRKAEELSVVLMQEKPYRDIVETVFEQKGIPYRFIKKQSIFESRSLEQAFNRLLACAQSDFALEDILPFLSNEHVLNKLQLQQEDYLNFELFVKRSNILYAIDQEHKEKLTTLKDDSHTWTKAFERLYVGLLSLDNELIIQRPPLDYSFLQWSKIAPFVELLKNLWQDSLILRTYQLSLREWFYYFFSFLERYLETKENAFLLLRQNLLSLLNLDASFVKTTTDLEEELYSFNYFFILLQEQLKALTYMQKESQGVLVGDLQNLSALPSHFSFVLGLKEESEDLPFLQNLNSLTELSFVKDSCKYSTTHQLIKLILQVKEYLLISYSSNKGRQSKKTIYSLHRPSCLNELINFLCQSPKEPYNWQWATEPLEQLIHIHPEHKSDPPYFDLQAKKAYLSFDQEAYEQAYLLNQVEAGYQRKTQDSYIAIPSPDTPMRLSWQDLKDFFDCPLALFFEKSLGIHLPAIYTHTYADNCLENFEPSSRLWTREFLVKHEKEGWLTCESLATWQGYLKNLLALKHRQDILENKLYTQKRIEEWYKKLSQLHALLSPYFPLKAENWLLNHTLEEESIGEWSGEYCQLNGPNLYKVYRKDNNLFILSAFEKNLYASDKAIILLQACLYKVHPYLKQKELTFDKVYILNNNLDAWQIVNWHEIEEEWFYFWQTWLVLTKKHPLPLCQTLLKELLSSQELNTFHDCFTFFQNQLAKIKNPQFLARQKTNYYLEKNLRYYQLLTLHPEHLPQDCHIFLSQLKRFWEKVGLEV